MTSEYSEIELDELKYMLIYLLCNIDRKIKDPSFELTGDAIRAAETIITMDEIVADNLMDDTAALSPINFVRKLLEGNQSEKILKSILNNKKIIFDLMVINLSWICENKAMGQLMDALNNFGLTRSVSFIELDKSKKEAA